MPDAFGQSVIRAYFTSRGEVERAFSPVQHLLYVGNRAMGALEFRSAFAEPEPGDIPSILKFDGVGGESSVGLLHLDYNEPGASSYEEYLRTMLKIGLPPAAVIEGYRRMVFNVLAVNQDDNVKNLSFPMDQRGIWSLTPAYDLTHAKGGGWAATHQMRVADKRSGITYEDLMGVGEKFGIRASKRIIERARDAVARWPEFAAEHEVPSSVIRHVEADLKERAGETSARSSS